MGNGFFRCVDLARTLFNRVSVCVKDMEGCIIIVVNYETLALALSP